MRWMALFSRTSLVFLALALAACEGKQPPSGGGATGGSGAGGRGGSGSGGASVTTGGAGGGGGAGAAGGSSGAGGGAGSGGGTGGGGAADGPAAETAEDAPGEDAAAGQVTVQALNGAHVYFAGEMDNHRRATADVTFPNGSWQNVTMRLRLRCPSNSCDHWDRWAYLTLVEGTAPNERLTEIMRFVTPYRLTADWTADVTALQPVLSGNRKVRVFIDTWVGPGHPQGNGWLVDVSFTFKPAAAGGDPLPFAVIPLWDVSQFEVGDPAKPVAAARPDRMVDIPAGARKVELHSFITGHGQGNLQNCAEFCQKTHSFTVGSMKFDRRIWRADCATTAVPNQPGTYRYPRAGWCPGALVTPWVEDVTAAAPAGAPISVKYAPEPYENTCRPTAPQCSGCAFNSGCAYNDGNHTSPNYAQSALLVVYK
jgi:hypothetical protein